MTTTRQPFSATRSVLGAVIALYAVTGSIPLAQAASPVTNYEYDANGNRTKVTDGLNHATVSAYDALNRVVRVTDANSGQTQYGYNALNQLTQVTDPKNLVTSYTLDGLGNLKQQTSPDTGTTSNTYDAAGNVLTKTDAKGQVTSYSFDALNRITRIVFNDSTQINYQYDQGTNGIGRLTGISDSLGSIAYAYDSHGRITGETRTLNNINYVTSYSYNSAGHLTAITYPSGRVISYTLDSLGRINQIATTRDSVSQVLASNIQYRPFGAPQGFLFGNGSAYTRQFDQDGRITTYTLGSQTMALGYDEASRLSFMSDAANPANSKNYGYDALDRLTQYTAPTENQGYAYDADGNRTALTLGGNSYGYSYPTTSNRLSTTQGPVPGKNYSYDANGSPTTDGTNQYAYDARGRLTQAQTASGTYVYGINALGQRVSKTSSTTGTVYHYDLQGRLIAESDAQGTVQKEYVYLNDMPLAVMK
jgi:YD repeat-containing protein